MSMKKFETSKIIVASIGVGVLIVTVFSMYMVYDTKNTEPLSILIPAVFGAFATAIGFYFNKAKLENSIKLRKKYGSEIYNDVKGEVYDSENY
jgi:H+/Cl- antiporter ClcA